VAIHSECEEGAMDHARRMAEEARAFKEAIASQAREPDPRDRSARTRPAQSHRMALAALGVGYVLGGGLFSPLTGRVVRIGIRLALIPLVKSQLSNIVGNAGTGEQASGQPTF